MFNIIAVLHAPAAASTYTLPSMTALALLILVALISQIIFAIVATSPTLMLASQILALLLSLCKFPYIFPSIACDVISIRGYNTTKDPTCSSPSYELAIFPSCNSAGSFSYKQQCGGSNLAQLYYAGSTCDASNLAFVEYSTISSSCSNSVTSCLLSASNAYTGISFPDNLTYYYPYGTAALSYAFLYTYQDASCTTFSSYVNLRLGVCVQVGDGIYINATYNGMFLR